MAEMESIVEFSSDVSDQEAPKPLPVGDYIGNIRSAEAKTSQNSGKRYAAVQFFVDPEQYPADYTEGDIDGTTLTYNLVSLEDTPRGRYSIKRFCEAIGAAVPGRRLDLSEWVGLDAKLSITHREYEGVQQANIKAVGKAD